MLPGDYEFNTGAREIMEMLTGGMDVLLPGQAGWQTFNSGESFEVPANSSFKLETHTCRWIIAVLTVENNHSP